MAAGLVPSFATSTHLQKAGTGLSCTPLPINRNAGPPCSWIHGRTPTPRCMQFLRRGVRSDRARASILLTHAPDHPETAETAGVSLQRSRHHTLGSSYLGVGWRDGFTGSLCMA